MTKILVTPTWAGHENWPARRLSGRQKVTLLGRDLRYVELPRDEAIKELATHMGEHAAWHVDGPAVPLEHPQRAVPTVAELTGRPATTFLQWACRNVDLFRNP